MEQLNQVLHMNGGDGDHSYAKNSSLQKIGVLINKKAIQEAIMDYYNLVREPPDLFVLADLGCSSGPNTLSFVSNVVEIVIDLCRQQGRSPPAFHAFFNDLPGSDFNTLFLSLPRRWIPTSLGEEGERCFVAGVPGSFYERLFPDKSVHLFHSVFANHFLSQAPRDLGQGLINKGCLYISRSSPQGVEEAYYKQFQRDFSTFLKLRAQELVNKGRMVLFLLSRMDGSQPMSCSQSLALQFFADILKDMAREGRLEEEKIDSFNVPVYFASASEVKREIMKEGSFSIKLIEPITSELPGANPQIKISGSEQQSDNVCRDTKSVFLAKTIRAAFESLLVAQFGEEIIDQIFFERFAMLIDEHLMHVNKDEMHTVLVSLEKI